MKKWIIGKADPQKVNELTRNGLSGLCAEVLCSRGIDTIEKAQSFFDCCDEQSLSDPFMLKDMETAADIINEAIERGKLICIYGDYDCDGITSTVALYSYIECMGGNVTYYINDRSEGYGINCDAVKKLYKSGIELIVTVDNGISAVEETKLAKELGMQIVITDHHQPPEILPEADAVVDPHQPGCMSLFKDLCGCGVVLKLIAAMDGGDYSSAIEQFSDLAAIATIADIVPLTGENRAIVSCGLRYIQNTENAGLKALIEVAGLKEPYTSTSVAFMLAPRINAAGRFATASEAVKLLLCEDYEEAVEQARYLEKLNNDRKKSENIIIEEIEKQINDNPSVLLNRVLVFRGKDWHHGVIGIVAAKLLDRFGKPVFVMSEDGEEYRGSVRSVDGFSAHKALSECADILIRFGGHSGAGGFSLLKSDYEKFRDRLHEYARNEYPLMPLHTIKADKILDTKDLSVESVKSLDILEPFGEANKKPVFVLSGAVIEDVIPLSSGIHTKLKLRYGNISIFALMFGTKTEDFCLFRNDKADILAYPEISSYMNKSSVILRVCDIRKSGIQQTKYFSANEAYEKYMRGEGADPKLAARIVPTRDDLAVVYRSMKKDFVSEDYIYSDIQNESMNYCKFRLCLEIFRELGLVEINYINSNVRAVTAEKKVSLDSSVLLQELCKLK